MAKFKMERILMLKVYLRKFLNILNFLELSILFIFLTDKKKESGTKKLLLIRLDSIGDYVLFRNFIKEVKEDNNFKGYKITLAGNVLWKNMAEFLDKDYIDQFIWIQRDRFYSNPFYKFQILKFINSSGFDIVINPIFTRGILFDDTLVKASIADNKVGSEGAPDKALRWKRRLLSDSYYTRLIPASEENLFEFYRNKEFFNNLLNKNIQLSGPHIEAETINYDIPYNKYLVIFPGAYNRGRRWGANNFISITKYILSNYSYDVLICGSLQDEHESVKIFKESRSEKVHDYTGRTSLLELIKILSGAELLIANDTSAIHISAALQKQFICISNGNHIGRFNPYPPEIFDKGYFVYPDEISEKDKNKLRFGSSININKIKPERIINIMKNLLP
ncbi:MAG: glycosyltransferase family 9 protein [Ignavibacteriaceae bacterium]|nr:glycosyltransferase family 9 protein [Ignavibacteriaceae bacterium]